MFQDVLHHMADAADYASIGLIIFFLVFVAVALRAITQTRQEVSDWSRLPLADDEGRSRAQFSANEMNREVRDE